MAENRISSSKREIYTKFLDVMTKYDPDLENSDYAKTGLIGWNFEINAMMMRDSTYHKSALYNEIFLNTAQIPKTVYNYAKMFNVEVEKATPAYADINIIIGESELANLMAVNGNQIVIDKEDAIVAGDYDFALEHSIKIEYNNTTGIFTASYKTPAEEYQSTNYQVINTYNLNIRQEGDNIVIPARAYQYRINKYNTQIISTNFLNKVQRYTFEDQFCGAKLFYVKNNKQQYVPLVYSELDNTETDPYAMYNLNDENELEIIFKEGDEYFTPSANSNIIVYIYTTKGSNVPKNYGGDALLKISNTDLKSLPIVVQFNPTNIIGGVDTASLDKLKQKIINEISISHTIVTQADLDDYFNKIITLISEINDGRIKFIKRRDDIIRRVFDSYLLLRDRTDDSVDSTLIKSDRKYISPCVPTNSIDVAIDLPGINTDTNTYELNMPKFVLDPSSALSRKYISTSDDIDDYYICPFNIYISKNDFNFVKYIYNLTDSISELQLKNSDTSNITFGDSNKSYYIIPINAELKRIFSSTETSFMSEDYYTLTINFTSNFSLKAGDTNPLSIDGNVIVSGLISTGEFEIIEFDSEAQNDSIYKSYITIKLPISEEGEFNSDDYDRIQLQSGASHLSFNSKEKISISFAGLTIGGFSLSNYPLLETVDKLQFFTSLDNIMSSEIAIDKNDNNIVYIEGLPVVHSSFFTTTSDLAAKKEGFIQQLFTYINKLEESSELLETSTNFNLKFYNTYGPSQLYKTPTTNLKVDMEIVLYRDYAENDALQQEIKSYIRRLVDVMNTNLGYIDIYKIIAILYDTEVYGSYIKNITFAAGSDTLKATIEPINTEGLDLDKIVPEWLNLDATYDGITFKSE